MNYDKNSFLSGIAVGRQLKGWGSAAAPLQGEAACTAAFSAAAVLTAAVSGDGMVTDDLSAYGILHFGDLVSIPVSAVLSGEPEGTPWADGVLAAD